MNDKRKQKRHPARDLLTVVDRQTRQPIADLANLSIDGAMFVSQMPVEIGHQFRCRLELPQPILNRNEIEFDAVCRWSKKNSAQHFHESGYSLTNVSDRDKEIISYLILRCVIEEWSNADTELCARTQESVNE